MATIDRRVWIITLAAAAILMVTMGTRQSLGLFVLSSPNYGQTMTSSETGSHWGAIISKVMAVQRRSIGRGRRTRGAGRGTASAAGR